MQGCVTVESGIWNQVQDDMEYTYMPWKVNARDRTITFDAFDLAWCVLAQFGLLQDVLEDGEEKMLHGILVVIEDEFMDQVRHIIFCDHEDYVNCLDLRKRMNDWLLSLARQRPLLDRVEAT